MANKSLVLLAHSEVLTMVVASKVFTEKVTLRLLHVRLGPRDEFCPVPFALALERLADLAHLCLRRLAGVLGR